jgi:hypothetical protein
MIKRLGYLEVPQYLIDIVEARTPGEHNSFVAGVDIPQVLAEFADKHGYEIYENGTALMFSSQVGVRLHADEMGSLIWVLCGTDCDDAAHSGNKSHELICDGIAHHLDNGFVYFVDTSLPHAVVATNHELWAVISMYVSKEA